MEEKKPSPTFIWKGTGDVTPLPTDYSPKYLEGKWDINDDIIAAFTTKNPEFDYFYQWMRYVSPEAKRDEHYIHRGIPAELEPFFHEYICHAREQGVDPKSLQDKSDDLKFFDKSLALHLHHMASNAEEAHSEETESVNSGLYWYRLLYNNPFFAKHISIDYWDREYDWRCQAIKELSQSLPVEERISFLKDMLSTLDIKISYVLLRRKQIKENSSNKKSSAKRQSSQRTKYSFLYSFPMQLINELRKSKRTKNTVPSNQRKEYFIPNPRLEIDNPEIRTMENAFPLMLSSHVNESTRAYIRSVYLDQICTTPTKSTFQKECEELQAYLDLYSTSPEKQQKYKEYAQHYCLRYYCRFWYSSPPLRDAFTNYPTNKLALDRLMDNIIGSYYRTYLEKVNSTAYIIQVYLNNPVEQCKYRHLAYKYIAFENGKLKTDLHLRNDALRINQDIQSLWIDGFLPSRTLQNNLFSKKDLEHICDFMEKHCSPAHELLAGSKLPWATKETFRKAWERFYQTQLDFSPSAVPAYCDVLDIYLVYSLIVLRTFVSYKETLTMTTELFDCFTEYINKKNSRSHKATCQDSVTSAEDSKQPGANRSGTGTGQP